MSECVSERDAETKTDTAIYMTTAKKKWHWLYTHLCVAHKSNQCARYHYLYIIAVTVAIAVNWLSINWSNIRYSDYEASVLYMDWLIVVATDQKKKNQLRRFFFSLHYLHIPRLHNWTESERIPVIEQKSLCHCIILPCSFSLNVTIKLKTNRGKEKQRHSVKIAIKKNRKFVILINATASTYGIYFVFLHRSILLQSPGFLQKQNQK